MQSVIEHIQSIITLVISASILNKFAMPALKKTIKQRRAYLIRQKLALQNDIKEARADYEKANYSYLDSFERKVHWMDNAEVIFQQRLLQEREKHKQIIDILHAQYEQSLRQINLLNRKNYISDLIEVVADSMSQDSIDYSKIAERIER